MPGRPRRPRSDILADDGAVVATLRCRPAVRLSGAPAAARDRRRPADRADLARARPAPDRLDERDVLVLVGPEPDYRWRAFCAAVVELSRRLGVVEWISLGAIPAAVPHTRPVPILGTEASPGPAARRRDRPARPGRCACRRRSCRRSRSRSRRPGIPALGYFAQVPHYVSGPYATAALELLRALGTHLGTEIAAGELTEEARELRTRLDDGDRRRRDDADLRRAARGDVRRAAAAVGRRPHLRHRAVPARPGRPGPGSRVAPRLSWRGTPRA